MSRGINRREFLKLSTAGLALMYAASKVDIAKAAGYLAEQAAAAELSCQAEVAKLGALKRSWEQQGFIRKGGVIRIAVDQNRQAGPFVDLGDSFKGHRCWPQLNELGMPNYDSSAPPLVMPKRTVDGCVAGFLGGQPVMVKDGKPASYYLNGTWMPERQDLRFASSWAEGQRLPVFSDDPNAMARDMAYFKRHNTGRLRNPKDIVWPSMSVYQYPLGEHAIRQAISVSDETLNTWRNNPNTCPFQRVTWGCRLNAMNEKRPVRIVRYQNPDGSVVHYWLRGGAELPGGPETQVGDVPIVSAKWDGVDKVDPVVKESLITMAASYPPTMPREMEGRVASVQE